MRARRGYFAPGRRDDEAKPAEGRDAAIQRALDAPFDLTEVPLRAIADVGPSREAGKATVRLLGRGGRARLRVRREGRPRAATRSSSCCSWRGRTPGEFTRFDQQLEMSLQPETRARYERDGFPIAREMPLAPGRYQARIVVRDRNGGRIGSLLHEFDVPAARRACASRRVRADGSRREPTGDGRGAPPAPEPTARRQFRGRGHAALPLRGVRRGDGRGERKAERDRRLLDSPQRRPVPRRHARDAARARTRRHARAPPRHPARRRAAGPLRGDRRRHRPRRPAARPRRASRS